jgi:DNA-binding transcriptional LysR family regulator
MNKLESMQTFVRVAEAGSFIAVANQLQVARSAVTRQIAALERHLGTQLITRSTRSLTLTNAGAAYLEKCRLILNMVDAAESSLAEEKQSAPRGRIRLGLPLTYGLQELMPYLLDFAQAHPLVELLMDFSDQRSNLIEEGLDLSIRITSDPHPSDIVRLLGQSQLLTIASPQYLSQHGEPRHPSDLQHHECLIYANDLANRAWEYREKNKGFQVPVRGRIVANNGVALMEAAAQGMGIARLPDFIASPYLADKRVRQILKNFEATPLGIYAVLPGNRYIPYRVSVLMAYLAQALTGTHEPRPSPPKSAGNIRNRAVIIKARPNATLTDQS